jgi:clan AA aspartic protease
VGTFSVSVEAAGPQRDRYIALDALVDTGASYTMLPAAMLDDLGVVEDRQRPFVLAHGARVTRSVGQAWVRLDGHEVMTVVVFGDEGALPLLGAVTLEEMGLGVDPLGRRLIEVAGLLM